jgi:hypothetical protein
MLDFKKLLKPFFLIIIIGFSGGILFYILHSLLHDEVLYRSPGIMFSLLSSVVITGITYGILLFSKASIYPLRNATNFRLGIYTAAITLIIFFVISRFSSGIDIVSVLNYLASITLSNFLISYLDTYLTILFKLESTSN